MGHSASGASGCCLKMRLMRRTATYGHEELRTPCPAGWGQAYLESHTWPVPTSASPQPRSGGRGHWVAWVKEWEEPCQPAQWKETPPRANSKLRRRAPCKAEEGAAQADAVLQALCPAGRTRVAVSATQPRPVQLGEGSTVHWPLVSCAALVSSQPPSSTW